MEDQSKETLATKMGDDNNRINLVLTVIAVVVAIVALIVACVGLSLKGTTQISIPSSSPGSSSSGSSNYEDKIWSVAIGHAQVGHETYIDEETGALRGFFVDMTNAICEIANKNCRVLHDPWNRCWDSQEGQVARGGIGLMSNWYDACAGWYKTYDRQRTFSFSDPFGQGDPSSLYVKPNSPLKSSWRNMDGKKIGILDGWWTDEFCLLRNKDMFSSGVPLSVEQIVHYAESQELLDGINNGDVDYAFQGSTTYVAMKLERVDGDPVIPCVLQGPGMMTRQINQEFLNWWNEAQSKLMSTKRYKEICQDIKEEHGDWPGVAPEDYCFL